MKKDAHEIVADIKRVAQHLQKSPTRTEYEKEGRFSERQIRKHFGGYSAALVASGVAHATKKKQKEEKFKYVPRKLQSFNIHELPLKAMFKRAGNPKVLKLVAQPDTHVKYRDVPAVNAFIKFLEWYDPDGHIIMGDFLDAEGLSHWPQDDLEPRRIVPEVLEARALLKQIVEATKSCTSRIYLEGNHEDWINQFVASGVNAQLFDGLEELGLKIDLSKLLDLDKFGYELFPLNHIVRIGKANFTHGLYTGNNHSSTHLSKLKTNIYYGHIHDTQGTNDCSMDGPMEAHSLGCLCRLDAKFLKGKPNKWAHSFGIYEMFPDGSYTFTLPKIINGRFAYNGVIFDGNTP